MSCCPSLGYEPQGATMYEEAMIHVEPEPAEVSYEYVFKENGDAKIFATEVVTRPALSTVDRVQYLGWGLMVVVGYFGLKALGVIK